MPKMKSVKGAVKRFKVKKNGTIKRGSAFRSHILTKKRKKEKEIWEDHKLYIVQMFMEFFQLYV